MYTLSDFDFDLPEELIAQFPLPERSASRLLLVDEKKIADSRFYHLIDHLSEGDLLVFNNTKVLKARFFGSKASGGKIEILIERILDNRMHWPKSGLPNPRKPAASSVSTMKSTCPLRVGMENSLSCNFLPISSRYWRNTAIFPCLPILKGRPTHSMKNDIRLVFARELGAVAAPTAGLHFDDELMEKLRQKGISFAYLTLHVGAGTFQPVRSENLSEHQMHTEWYTIPEETVEAVKTAQQGKHKVVGVGTTAFVRWNPLLKPVN